MLTGTRTFRVFVGSTLADLKAERDALAQRVFPRLRELCRHNGARFQAVDLRWGVSGEASLDQRTMLICLEVAGELLRNLVGLVTRNPAVAPHNELVYRPSLRIEKLG